jgi:hypothetical protein
MSQEPQFDTTATADDSKNISALALCASRE